MSDFYSCKLDKNEQLNYYPSNKVRWLDLDSEFEMVREYYSLISSVDINKEDFIDPQWKMCALVDDEKILAYAGVLFMTHSNWEIGAVSTHPEQRNKGYAKNVCSFIAKFILENGKQATCNTDINNHAMRKVMTDIGMIMQ